MTDQRWCVGGLWLAAVLGLAVGACDNEDSGGRAPSGVDPDPNAPKAAFVVTSQGSPLAAGSEVRTQEKGAPRMFAVSLAVAPTAEVRLSLTSSAPGEGTASPSELRFDAGNWSVPQSFSLDALDDDIADGDVAFQLGGTVTSEDAAWNGLTLGPITVVNEDDDKAGVSASLTGDVTTEAGGAVELQLVLSSRPLAPVTLRFSVSDEHEAEVSPASVVVEPGDWALPQTVTVKGLDDAWDDGDVGYAVLLETNASDPAYDALSFEPFALRNTDDDTRGFIVEPKEALVTSEGDETASAAFSVRLATRPLGDAEVTFSVAGSPEAEAEPAGGAQPVGDAHVLNAANGWALEFRVRGVDDVVDDGDQPFTFAFGELSGADYDGEPGGEVSGTNLDNDVPGIVVSTASLRTHELGTTATFDVGLTTRPYGEVTLSLRVPDDTEGALDVESLRFTNADWAPKPVTLEGLAEAGLDGDVTHALVIGVSDAPLDEAYLDVDPIEVPVVNEDLVVKNLTAGLQASGCSRPQAGNGRVGAWDCWDAVNVERVAFYLANLTTGEAAVDEVISAAQLWDEPSALRSDDGKYLSYLFTDAESTNRLLYRVDASHALEPELVPVDFTGAGPGRYRGVDSQAISSDGRFVAFVATLSNIHPDDDDARPDVFVRDLQSGKTILASVNNLGEKLDDVDNWEISLAPDGSFVSFVSMSDMIDPRADAGYMQLFTRDILSGVTSLVTVSGDGLAAGDGNVLVSSRLGAKGRFIAFASDATNLITGRPPTGKDGVLNAYLRDLTKGTTRLISASRAGVADALGVTGLDLSDDGERIVFSSPDPALLAPLPAPHGASSSTLFAHDARAAFGFSVPVSRYDDGTLMDLDCTEPSLSADGRVLLMKCGPGERLPPPIELGAAAQAIEGQRYDIWSVELDDAFWEVAK